MKTSDKEACRIIIDLLNAYGVEDVVLSPGSRNTPLIVAANRHQSIKTNVVIDERTAAFFGLGISLQTRKPVALICTSGTAVLNYAPAVAEAYYRHIPLIVISADRPAEWIDQDDSQTIRQNGVLDNIVKGSFDINGENGSKIQRRFVERSVNDAIITATRGPQGPVHINIRLDEPLGNLCDADDKSVSKIEFISPSPLRLDDAQYQSLADELKGKKIMVIAGFGHGDSRLDSSLEEFVKATDAVLLHEMQSNIKVRQSIGFIDACLSTFTVNDNENLKPDIVITFGGSLVSRMIKHFLRDSETTEHWHIAESTNSIDCFMALSKRIECDPAILFGKLAALIKEPRREAETYFSQWMNKASDARKKVSDKFTTCGWSDFYAVGRLLDLAPSQWNLHLSNGTAIRYAQLFATSKFNSVECNRGVSGIDGSTSTAIGSQVYSNDTTLLLTGDMSAQYDMGALALTEIIPRFKMVVLNNSGGGIFRFIKSTSRLEECEECFAAKVRLPLKELAAAFGFAYFEASDKNSLDSSFEKFSITDDRPAMLNIITPAAESAEILKSFFK